MSAILFGSCRNNQRLITAVTAAMVAVTFAITSIPARAGGPGNGKGLIRLPVNEVVRLTYTGEEYFYDANGNGDPDEGDVMEGIAIVDSITSVDGSTDYSHQLKTRELTVAFRFSITAGAMSTGHIEFSLLEGDYFRLFVGTGNRKNYDALKPDSYERATDGSPWIAIEPDTFFQSVNDYQYNENEDVPPSTLNRAWSNISGNYTRYRFMDNFFPTLIERDPSHVFDGEEHGDLPVQLYFENFVHGISDAYPRYTFDISGHFYVDTALGNASNRNQ